MTELVTIRLFYWHFGHTQVAFTPFVQIAGIGGAMLVSFVMFWLAEACVRMVIFRERRWTFLLPWPLSRLAGYGAVMMQHAGIAPWRKTRGRARPGPAVARREARHRLDLAKLGSHRRTEPAIDSQGGADRLA